MNHFFETYKRLCVHGELISLEARTVTEPFFCYPTNAEPIGFEGCIMYCFIDGYGDVVFAANPESCGDQNVYPLAANFEEFLGLILACGSANPVEQIVWMDREGFEQHMQEEQARQSKAQKELLDLLARELHIAPMEDPFEYVKHIQAHFDGSKIQYSDAYYDVLGIER